MTHRKNVALLVAVAVVIVGLVGYLLLHAFTREIDETVVYGVSSDAIEFDCTDEMNKWNSGDRNDMAIGCTARISEDTTLEDLAGNKLSMDDFSHDDRIRIVLARPYNIREGLGSVEAKKVILMSRSDRD
ncbi:hypothetical protein [Paenibacillus methanolicus]|uniref:Uncharacterized protein n=1 Tax=Paenibacillus methanolicus TaxID=582686 RepID=A0A5S5C5Z8_9BACL|nr:hypothetical protein [Paenibacillus methanolicus]TYP74855.1 hypothetical protein BCM02_105402 [Paenibacillus methanolicus]